MFLFTTDSATALLCVQPCLCVRSRAHPATKTMLFLFFKLSVYNVPTAPCQTPSKMSFLTNLCSAETVVHVKPELTAHVLSTRKFGRDVSEQFSFRLLFSPCIYFSFIYFSLLSCVFPNVTSTSFIRIMLKVRNGK